MKILAVKRMGLEPQELSSSNSNAKSVNGGGGFAGTLLDIGSKAWPKKDGLSLENLQQQLINAPELNPRQLLLYQIKVGQLGLRVELISKLAESATATVRKLQGN